MKYLNKNFIEACKWLADENNLVVSSDTNLEPRTLRSTLSLGSSKNLEPKAFDASRYERFFMRPWLSNEARKFLFEERRLDPRVVRYCQLTSWKDKQGVPWLQIPYYAREGRLIGIQNRNLVKGGSPRFRFPSGPHHPPPGFAGGCLA